MSHIDPSLALDASLEFEYDKLGNRTNLIDNFNNKDITYNYKSDKSHNQLLGVNGEEYFEYDANGNLIYDNRPGQKATYIYDYRNRLTEVRPERWDIWYDLDHGAAEPGFFEIDNTENALSYFGRDNTGNKFSKRAYKNPISSIESISLDIKRAEHIDCDKFIIRFYDGDGDYFQIYYFYRDRKIRALYCIDGNKTFIYSDDYYRPSGFLDNYENFRIEMNMGIYQTYFYINGQLKGNATYMGQIGPIEDVEIKLTEAHYHFGNIKINSYSGGTTTLSFEDGPYAEYAEYVYNANDERIKKIKFGNYPVKTYIYDGNGRVLSEYLTNRYGSTSLDYNYLYGNNRRLARIDASGNVDYFHTDYLGSSILIDDNWERFYYPFGRELEASGSGNDYKFTGKQQDSESGLYYYWHRYYDSELGRFISMDPRWDKYPGLTPYQYCANNPLKFVDRTGEEVEFDDEESANNTAEELNKLHNNKTNITVESKANTSINIVKTLSNFLSGNYSFSFSTSTSYILSTTKSDFNWGQNKYTSALFDCINSKDISFNVKFGSYQNLGGGKIESKPGGGIIKIDPNGYEAGNESFGVVFLHELIGHGHPVTSKMSNPVWAVPGIREWGYPNKPGNATLINKHYNGYYNAGHAGYHKKIGWKRTGLWK